MHPPENLEKRVRRTKSKHEGKRQEILEAASRVFLRDGLQGASISAICSEAQISPGHLYHYFDSKEAILEAIAEAYLANAQEHFGKLAASASVVSTIISEIEETIEFSNTGRQALFFELIAEASRNPRIAEVVRKSTGLMRSLFADFIRKGQERGEVDASLDPETTAFVIINLIDAAKMTRTRDADLDIMKNVSLMSMMITRLLANSSSARKPRGSAV